MDFNAPPFAVLSAVIKRDPLKSYMVLCHSKFQGNHCLNYSDGYSRGCVTYTALNLRTCSQFAFGTVYLLSFILVPRSISSDDHYLFD